MTRIEITGKRDLIYSGWHRELADFITYIDIDACEYCEKCREPLALIEIARDTNHFKATIVTRKLAQKANIPAYLVFYKVDENIDKIISFRTRQISPIWKNELIMSPTDYAEFLSNIHKQHQCKNTAIPG